MADERERRDCQHPGCSCLVRGDQDYCSAYCEGAGDTVEIGCECGHRDCAGAFGARGWGRRAYGAPARYGERDYGRAYERGGREYDYDRHGFERGFGYRRPRAYGERDWGDRASDEMASWFGDEEAARRRRMDQRRDRDEHGRATRRGRGPKGYRRSDERIREDVSDRLSDDDYVDASDIEVAVNSGEVTLSGTVASRREKRLAEDLADTVSGVTHVQNNLRVDRGDLSAAASSTSGTTAAATTEATAGTGTTSAATRRGTAAGGTTT